ncbi:hypothetical protein JCM10207_002144 [Rhodosporidiobolus poonsookiae]
MPSAATQIPTRMKAAMYHGAHDIRIEEVDVPRPTAGQVLVKVIWCGICGSDLKEYKSGPVLCPSKDKPHAITGCTLPVCLGHEFSGIVVEVGQDVTGDFALGDRVVIEAVISCGDCYACQIGCNNACMSLGFVGLSGLGGGLSEYFASPEQYLHKLPDHVSLKSGAMCEPLAVAIHAVKRSGFRPGQSALVLGAGPIGCFLTKVLIAQGASQVIVSEPSSTRREKAAHAGAHHLFDPLSTDIVSTVKSLTSNAGVHVAFEAAGNPAALKTGLEAVRTRGTVCNVSVWSRAPSVEMNTLVFGEKTITGSSCYVDDHPDVMKALSSGLINLDDFVTATIPIEDLVQGGFEELIHNNEQHVKILVSPSSILEQPF